MYKSIFIGIWCLLALFACTSKKESTDIPKEEFTEILLQMYVLEGYQNAQTRAKINDTLVSTKISPSIILDDYNYSEEQFEKAHSFYTEDKDEMVKIYDEVLNRLSIINHKIEQDTLKKYHLPIDKNLLQFSKDSLSVNI